MDVLKLGMKLYVRYIDDIRVAMRSMTLGAQIINRTLRIDQEQREKDLFEENPDEVATARVIRQIMDNLLPGIRFTSETSGDFPGQWSIPTLDTMWRMEGRPPQIENVPGSILCNKMCLPFLIIRSDLENFDLITQSGFHQRKFYAKKTRITPHVYLQKTA